MILGAIALFLLALEPYFMVFFSRVPVINPGLFYQRLLLFNGWGAVVLFVLSLAIVLAFRILFSQDSSAQRPLIAWLVILLRKVDQSSGQSKHWLKHVLKSSKVEVGIWLGKMAVLAFF